MAEPVSAVPRTDANAVAYDRGNVIAVIPALNEALRIREVVEGALRECDRVIVIDDGSDDGTAACIADLPVVLLRHERRMGKGASLRDGFREALRLGAAAVLTMDGDGQHLASDIPRLIELWQAGRLDLDAMVTSRRPLEQVDEALDDMAAGKGLRTVLVLD